MTTVREQLSQFHDGAITFDELLADFGNRDWPMPPRPTWSEAREAPPPDDDDSIQISIANGMGWITDAQRTQLIVPVINWRAVHRN